MQTINYCSAFEFIRNSELLTDASDGTDANDFLNRNVVVVSVIGSNNFNNAPEGPEKVIVRINLLHLQNK